MPTPFTSTFASAAASTNGENSGARSNNNAGNDWSRSRVNGATQTFRRPSVATTPSNSNSNSQAQTQAQPRDMPPTTNANHGGVYIPPHLNANHPSNSTRSLPLGDARYSKDQLLTIYQTLKDSAALDRSLEDIFLGSWDPRDGKSSVSNQGGRGDSKDQTPGPEVCWNYTVEANPFGMTDLTEDEKQLFSTSVNSPIKLQQNTTKENTGAGTIAGRKASLSGYSSTTQGSRPGTRRRETSDSYASNGPLSPVESKTFFRGDSNTATPPPALLRRRTDFKDEEATPPSKDEPEGDDPTDSQPQFPGLRRSATGPLSAGLHPPSGSPWSAGTQAGGFASMGSFGSFAIGSATTPTETADKRPGFGSARGGSRFKDLLSKTSSEDIGQSIKDKASFGALEKLPEEDADAAQSRSREGLATRPGRSETNPYEEIPGRTGSAALGGSQENIPAPQGIEQMGFSAYGPQSNIGTRDFGNDDPYQQTPHGRFNPHEPMSPTNTNPYQSPHGRLEDDDQDTNDSASQASGLPPFGGNRRNVFPNPDDRGPGAGLRGAGAFGNLGFGSLGGGPTWSAAGIGSGKPALDRAIGTGFGDPIFSPLTDLQSPGAGGLGGGFFAAGGFGSAGRASRLGAMFPPAMQEQMRGDSRNEIPSGSFDSRPDSAQHISRDPFDSTGRRLDGFGRGSSSFEESPPVRTVEDAGNLGPAGAFGPSASGPQTTSLPTPQSAMARAPPGTEGYQSAHGLSQSSGSSSSNQMPAAQQRQMVMPDRMRWIYRDPQGNTQGPWSGLEMHDWFKAGFFTAELQVKKLEDTEYEPLAQLVRRIGNSREPFLVPQIGVPHGPPSVTQGNHWATSMAGSGGSAQPPFASSFPSFGTTLTAEQQNALERRKQEEQFLMARQKEHLAQQQMAMKHMQIQNGLHSLQHHSSAHSLQSQPSFGSITSPTGYQPSPMQGPIQPPPQPQPQPGQSFGAPGAPNPGQAFGGNRDEDVQNMIERLSFSQRANLPYSGGPLGPPPTDAAPSSQQVSSILQDRARLQQQQQQQSDIQNHQDTFLGQQGRNDRLEEFHTLRGEVDSQTGRLGPDDALQQPIGSHRQSEEQSAQSAPSKPPAPANPPTHKGEHESLSLAQQVQIAAASQQAAAEESAWARTDAPIDPPPVSISPLPAPAAQRNRQHVADALAADSRSATQTPIETPTVSIAPWAERTAEHPKGPSLKEIQEAEAKRAAEQEEIAAAARRAQAEQERLVQAQAPIPAPGLPLTSTWGASSSPVGAQSSVWGAKPVPTKPGPASAASAKKTLAQIQKEEESRKQRAAAAAATAATTAGVQTTASPTSAAVGKRYAELASKAAPAVPNPAGGAWMTVGSNGKSKVPPPVVASPQPAVRTVSSTVTATVKARPTLSTPRSSNLPNQGKANEEFAKWIKGSLGKGLNSNINLDSFVQDLLMLPPEVEIISDSVYASSQTLDGRRFAEEFVRRRKLADKGIVELAANGAQGLGADNKSGAGGWSEVAKKGPAPKEESNSAFKVVATKKKGKR